MYKKFAKVVIVILLVVILLPTAVNAQSAFEPWSFFTWLLGSVWSRPKNFERPEGAYLTLKLRTPERLVSVLGPTVIVDPTSRLGRMCEAGIKLYTIADNGWTTDADVDFHKSRDTCVEKAAVEVSFNPQNKASGNVTKKLVLWREEFENANGAEVRVYPPKSVADEVSEEWQEVLSHSKSTGDVIILTVTVYVERPTKVKGSQSFQVFVAPATTLAKITNYRDQGMGIALQDADKENKNEIREEKGISVRVLVKNSSALNETFRPVSLAIFDSLGEVYRGEVEDGQEFKVVPETKSGTIRICQLENEIPLSMYPETLTDKNNCQSGYIRVSENSELAVYPAGFSGRVGKIDKGLVKVYAPIGSVLPITFAAKGEGVLNQTVRVNNFGGRVISVKTNQPQDEIIVTLKGITQKITSESEQIVFNMETIGALRSYSRINVNPAKKGGIHSKAQLASYAATGHFRENVAATGVDPKELDIFQRQALEGKAGYTIVGPQTKTFSDNGSQITSVNLIKSLTECGPDGRPIGHKAYYQTTFRDYHRVWVPSGQYGWVPGIISTCGNAVMVYMAPPKKNYPLRLAIAPPPEEPMKVSWDNLLLSVANIKQGNLVITPSSIAPYIPQTQIDIKNSQSQAQGQNQHQSQGQTQNSTNTNVNVNNNTNINNNTIDVNNTNNNINQNQTILNNANANN